MEGLRINGCYFYLQDDGNVYRISTQDENCDYDSWSGREYKPLIEYINRANYLNGESRASARNDAIQQKRINAEFEQK